ncbi:uveal autoantigen with coiled-coil domains and ankyrin repeats-like [Ambystoma mexicanum]|uniref:uveal autoantigen with coiled-coil domains and ankyrin repeats-like n=1 Tax=Ambystoma mexicanum TaxID=8296 RepID=UPI0037E744CC
MAEQGRGKWLEKHQAHIRALRQKLGLQTHQNEKIRTSEKPHISGNSKMALIDLYLSGKELPKEVERQSGQLGVESMRQGYAEILKISHESSSKVSTPKQRLIDHVLARRSIEQFEKTELNNEVMRKLNEEKEALKKELTQLQSQMKHFTDVSPRPLGSEATLHSRIASTRAHLPDLESRVQSLREELHREAEDRLRPYLKKPILPEDESHSLEDIEMVKVLLSELVEEVMDDYLRRLPEGMDANTAAQLHLKEIESFREKTSCDRGLQLTADQLVLESTHEMAKQAANEVFIVESMGAALGFNLIFNSVQRTRKSVTATGGHQETASSEEELAGILLQQINERDLQRKDVWKHTQKERPRTK